MPITPIPDGINFPGILSAFSTDNTSKFPLVETKNVRGGIVFPAANLATEYPGNDQDTASTVVPFSSIGFEGTGSGDYILKVCVSGGLTEGMTATSWEPLADYLGGVGGSFMLAEATGDTQTFGGNDASAPHLATNPSVIRLGVGPDYSGNNVKEDGLTASMKDEISDGGIEDTIRFGLTNATNLSTTPAAGSYATNTGVSDDTNANVMAWSPDGNGGQLIPAPIQVKSDGTNFTTTIAGNLTLSGTLNYGNVVQANTLSVDDKFIVLNDGFVTQYDSVDLANTAQSQGGLLVQIGTVDGNNDGDSTDLGETKYKAFYWDATTGNWSFADAQDADDGTGTADGYTFSNVSIMASKTNLVDLHFGDTVATPSQNLEWNSKFVTPLLLSTYTAYDINESVIDNTASVPDITDVATNNLILNTDSSTFVRFSRIWHVQGQVTAAIISAKKMHIDIPRSENDDYYDKPPVVEVFRTYNDGDGSVREQVMTQVKIREIAGDHDRIEVLFAQWPGGSTGLTAGDLIMVRILH